MASPESSPWAALAGVLLGALLGEGCRYARYRWKVYRNKKLLRAELQTVQAQLPQKRDILQQAISQLKEQRFIPTLSCRIVAAGYYRVLEDLYPHLSLRERTCLHIIFERLRIADEQMDGFEDGFLNAVKDQLIDNPWGTYAGRLEELLKSYSDVEHLCASYLAGKPEDVFSMDPTN